MAPASIVLGSASTYDYMAHAPADEEPRFTQALFRHLVRLDPGRTAEIRSSFMRWHNTTASPLRHSRQEFGRAMSAVVGDAIMCEAWEAAWRDLEAADDAQPPTATDATADAIASTLPSFVCPLSMTVMTDPVMAADGHCFQRSAITEWFRRRGAVSPVTHQPLPSMDVLPVVALRNAIADYTSKRYEGGSIDMTSRRRRTWITQ